MEAFGLPAFADNREGCPEHRVGEVGFLGSVHEGDHGALKCLRPPDGLVLGLDEHARRQGPGRITGHRPMGYQ